MVIISYPSTVFHGTYVLISPVFLSTYVLINTVGFSYYFGVNQNPARGFDISSSYVLMCIFAYQITVYYNCITGNDNPRCVKRMFGN
ncbi:MAG: hypothetical protein KGI02_08380 [Thaumarchaeota archaeon]|nr:hypothetical protein [Nitrososphaerota archaeon]MDE1840437.1 hypothetical protein [Nitrososphaerota archaeon]MDE1878147.1 hypothetical protein [Nitrososphaerota archaeon]